MTGILGVASGVQASKKLRTRTPRADPLVCAAGLLLAAPFLYLSIMFAQASTAATYVSHSFDLSSDLVLSESSFFPGNVFSFFLLTAVLLLNVGQFYADHNGGWLFCVLIRSLSSWVRHSCLWIGPLLQISYWWVSLPPIYYIIHSPLGLCKLGYCCFFFFFYETQS